MARQSPSPPKKSKPTAMQAPQAGGVDPAAMQQALSQMSPAMIQGLVQALAAHGQGNDSVLAHVNPKELKMLQAHSGVNPPNPVTGAPQFDDTSGSGGGPDSSEGSGGGTTSSDGSGGNTTSGGTTVDAASSPGALDAATGVGVFGGEHSNQSQTSIDAENLGGVSQYDSAIGPTAPAFSIAISPTTMALSAVLGPAIGFAASMLGRATGLSEKDPLGFNLDIGSVTQGHALSDAGLPDGAGWNSGADGGNGSTGADIASNLASDTGVQAATGGGGSPTGPDTVLPPTTEPDSPLLNIFNQRLAKLYGPGYQPVHNPGLKFDFGKLSLPGTSPSPHGTSNVFDNFEQGT